MENKETIDIIRTGEEHKQYVNDMNSLTENTRCGVPTIEEARLLLDEAAKINPGPWVEHSIYAGKAAELIAKNCEWLDSEVALVLGMLHDIGRIYCSKGMKHTLDGYNFAMEKGYDKLAKICLTHSFDYKDIKTGFGKWDCTEDEYNFVKEYLENVEYDDYDRLIQICDALALPSGFCIIEKRMIDVALRHGVHEHTVKKWKATFQIKEYFEKRMGKSIYSLLPGIVDDIFKIS